SRTVGHKDAELGGGGDVDGIDAGTRANDQRQGGAGTQRIHAHLLAAHDEDVGVDPADQIGQGVGLDVGLGDDGAAQLLQSIDADLLEFVGDENLHSSSGRYKSGVTSRESRV